MTIKVSNVVNGKSVVCGDLMNGTVCIHNGEAIILGKDVTSINLPESLQNCRHSTKLTGNFAGSQGMIRKETFVELASFTLEVTHD